MDKRMSYSRAFWLGLLGLVLAPTLSSAQTPASALSWSTNPDQNALIDPAIPAQNTAPARSYMPALRGVMAGVAQALNSAGQPNGLAKLDVDGRFSPNVLPASAAFSGIVGAGGLNLTGKGGTTTFVRPAINLPDGLTLYSATSDFSTPKGFEILADKVLLSAASGATILTKPNSTAQALHAVQSGPASGSIAGPIALNSFDMSWSSEVTGNYGAPGLVGSGALLGMQYSMNVGGPNYQAQQAFTLSTGLTHNRGDTSGGDKGAFSAGVYSSAPTNGLIDGIVTSVVADSGSSSPQIAGIEMDMTILGTGTTLNRLGSVVVNTGAKQGTVADIAYALTTGGPDGRLSGSFKTLLGLYKQDPSLPNAMPSDGTIFKSDHALTLKNILDGSNITVTDNIILFPGSVWSGGGKITTSQIALYGLPPATPTGQVSYGGSTAASSFCGSLAGSSGCVLINANGTQRYIPYY